MSAAPEPAESSQTRQGAEPEKQRKWVALLSAPLLLRDDDDDRDMELDLDDPPRPSRLLLRNRCAHDPRRRRDTDEQPSANILAVAADRSSRVLVQFGEGGIIYLLDADANARTVIRLPPVPSSLRKKSLYVSPDRSIGLIAHPHSPAHYVVAQLHPGRHLRRPRDRLLYYSTFTQRWAERELAQPQGRTRDPSAEHGVIAHDGRLWWLALGCGLFSCDPLGTEPLRFLPLPDDCELADDVAFNPGTSKLIKQRRCVRASEGKLRFIEIRGLSYDVRAADDVLHADATIRMWTLVDPEGPDPWKVEYEAPFAEIWAAKTYTDAGLPQRKVPHVAFVDPDNHGVVYFLYGSKLFGLNIHKRQVVACEEGYGDREHMFHRPVVDAWKLSPPTPPMLHTFPRGTHVRLRVFGMDGFVEARDNGKAVVLSTWGTMPHSAWIIDYVEREGKPLMLLQSSAYGRYLAHSGVLDSKTVSDTAMIVDYFDPEQQDELLWQVEKEKGMKDGVRVFNARYGPWNLEAETVWRLETILATPTPPRPQSLLVTPQEYHGLRHILHFQANDAGEFDWGDMFSFYGSSLLKLRSEVEQQQQLLAGLPGHHQPQGKNNPLCVRAGSYGRLTPLVTDLPHSAERMDIVVLTNGSPAADALRYSNLNEE